MKRSILAVAAILALGSASAFAQTAGVRPSFNDAPDLAAMPITGSLAQNNNFPKGFVGSGGPTGPATVIAQDRNQSNDQYAHSSAGATTRSDAVVDDSGKGDQPAPTLNDTFHYPSSD
jgi:hypothetical protein